MDNELLETIKDVAFRKFCAERYNDEGAIAAYRSLLLSLEAKYFEQKDASRDLLRATLASAIKQYEAKFTGCDKP